MFITNSTNIELKSLNTKNQQIDINNSSVNIQNLNSQTNLKYSNLYIVNNSKVIINKSNIDISYNISSIYIDKSKLLLRNSNISKNSFTNHFSLSANNHSILEILNSTFYNKYCIYLNNSQATMYKNLFYKIKNYAITLDAYSKANIEQNSFSSIKNAHNYFILLDYHSEANIEHNSFYLPFYEYSIYLKDTAKANIIDNKTNKKYSYFGYATDDSKVWFSKGQEYWFKTPSIGDDQVVKSKLDINVSSVDFQINTIKQNFNRHIKKGWLKDDYKLDEMILTKDSYIEYDVDTSILITYKNKKLIKKLNNIPPLYIDKDKQQVSLDIAKNNSKFRFIIDTKRVNNINKISLNNIDLVFYKLNNQYQTESIILTEEKEYKIKIYYDDSIKEYQYDYKNNSLSSKKVKKEKVNAVSGKLANDILVINDKEMEEANIIKNTFFKYDLNKKIVLEPKEYYGYKLAEDEQIEFIPYIKITPIFENSKLSFDINSNKKITSVNLNDKALKYKNNKTWKRKISNINRTYILKVEAENITKVYECNFDNTMICKERHKVKVD